MKDNQDDEFRARGMHTKSCKKKKRSPHQRGDEDCKEKVDVMLRMKMMWTLLSGRFMGDGEDVCIRKNNKDLCK